MSSRESNLRLCRLYCGVSIFAAVNNIPLWLMRGCGGKPRRKQQFAWLKCFDKLSYFYKVTEHLQRELGELTCVEWTRTRSRNQREVKQRISNHLLLRFTSSDCLVVDVLWELLLNTTRVRHFIQHKADFWIFKCDEQNKSCLVSDWQA